MLRLQGGGGVNLKRLIVNNHSITVEPQMSHIKKKSLKHLLCKLTT